MWPCASPLRSGAQGRRSWPGSPPRTASRGHSHALPCHPPHRRVVERLDHRPHQHVMATKGSERAAPVTRSLPHVVIVGGGFGGLYAARALADRRVRVTILDRRNHHLFQPLLYQVATAAWNASDIAVTLRSVLRKATNVTVLLAEIERVDLANRRLVLDRGEMGYDALVLAAGASPSDFGPDGWGGLAPRLKTLGDGLESRRPRPLAHEAAEPATDGAQRPTLPPLLG